MKNRKLGFAVVGIVILLVLVIILISLPGREPEEELAFSPDYIAVDELQDLFSFVHYDAGEWQSEFEGGARGRLSYGELKALLQFLEVEEYVSYEEGNSGTDLSRENFFQVYDQIVAILDKESSVKNQDFVFILERNEGWLTQAGDVKLLVDLPPIFPNDMYETVVIHGKVAGLRGIVHTALTWENVFVHTASPERGGMEVLFDRELHMVSVEGMGETITDTICDIEWKDTKIDAIHKKEESIFGRILSYNESSIEVSDYGVLSHTGDLKIYKTYGTVEQLDSSKLVVGNLWANFVVANREVVGIILTEPAQNKDIRVLILNESSPFREEVLISSDQGFTLRQEGVEHRIEANEVVRVSAYIQNDASRFLEVIPGEGSLFLLNESMERDSLPYQGHMEIRKYPEGYGVVNELSLEDYLRHVVPSEMPASYEREALKAQAVCARSYAIIQLAGNSYANLAANVDDTTRFQVYNKQPTSEKTDLAVADTIGEVVKYQGEVAETYYFSTSAGFSQEVSLWNLSPDGSMGYLRSISLLNGSEEPDFESEESVLAFVRSNDIQAYDSDVRFFRWRAGLDMNGNLEKVNTAIVARGRVSSQNVQVFDGAGNLLFGSMEEDLASLGGIIDMEISRRLQGGGIFGLRLLYERGSVLVSNEFNIRSILGVAVATLRDKEGADFSMSLLPSSIFSIVQEEEGMVLYGGGYGHGIGMSQNGANGMAKAGNSYLDILQKFYQNISIENIYQ